MDELRYRFTNAGRPIALCSFEELAEAYARLHHRAGHELSNDDLLESKFVTAATSISINPLPSGMAFSWYTTVMHIRFAEPIDLTTIMSFDAFPGDRIVEIVERRMLVVEINGRVEAYASWQKNGCIGKDYVNKLVVNQDFRRRGLAKRLIVALNTALGGRVFISAPASNVAAIGLLKSMQWMKGGEIIGLLPFGEAEVFFYKDL